MKKLMISVSAAAMMVSLTGVANAAFVSITTGFFSDGSNTTNPGLDITFDSTTPLNTIPTPGETSPLTGPTTIGPVTFTGTGYVVQNTPNVANAGGVSAAPYISGLGTQDATPYLSIGINGQETLSFSSSAKQLGFYWGSIDTGNAGYNRLEFYHTGDANPFLTFSGVDMASLFGITPSGAQQDPGANKYVHFDFSQFAGGPTTFDTVKLSANQYAFELDNVSYLLASGGNTPPVPEASTWAMMILGFLGVGFISYRRRSQGVSLRIA